MPPPHIPPSAGHHIPLSQLPVSHIDLLSSMITSLHSYSPSPLFPPPSFPTYDSSHCHYPPPPHVPPSASLPLATSNPSYICQILLPKMWLYQLFISAQNLSVHLYCLLPPSPVITCQDTGHSSRPSQILLLHKAALDSATLPQASCPVFILLVPLPSSCRLLCFFLSFWLEFEICEGEDHCLNYSYTLHGAQRIPYMCLIDMSMVRYKYTYIHTYICMCIYVFKY